MLTPIGNIHRSKLPGAGEIVSLVRLNIPGKWIVESFPLCDNVWPYSHGIHTCTVRSLANNQVTVRVAGIWCTPLFF